MSTPTTLCTYLKREVPAREENIDSCTDLQSNRILRVIQPFQKNRIQFFQFIITNLFRSCHQIPLQQFTRGESQFWCPVIIEAALEMRHEILETIEQLFLSDDIPLNECNHVDDSCLADFYLRFSHLPLNGHQKHPFQ